MPKIQENNLPFVCVYLCQNNNNVLGCIRTLMKEKTESLIRKCKKKIKSRTAYLTNECNSNDDDDDDPDGLIVCVNDGKMKDRTKNQKW